MTWRNRPTFKNNWDEGADYSLFIDESGDASLKHIIKQIERGNPIEDVNKYFTITGIAVKRENLKKLRDDMMQVKEDHWEEGFYNYELSGKTKQKRVCFHSIDIRRRRSPFSACDINYDEFIIDLSKKMETLPIKIFSSTIDKEKHYKRYTSNALHPYNLCLNFILERYVKFYLPSGAKTYIILESRGKKEDREILNHIKTLMRYGTYYTSVCDFAKIKGVYFNPKWCQESDEKKSYFGLEVADLCSYPIHRFSLGDSEYKAFNSICNKIYNYPNINGFGLKKFP